MSKFVSRGCTKDLHQHAIRSEVKRHATALQRRMDRAKLRSPATQLGELRKFTPVVLESGVHPTWIPAKCLHGHEWATFQSQCSISDNCVCWISTRSTVTALASPSQNDLACLSLTLSCCMAVYFAQHRQSLALPLMDLPGRALLASGQLYLCAQIMHCVLVTQIMHYLPHSPATHTHHQRVSQRQSTMPKQSPPHNRWLLLCNRSTFLYIPPWLHTGECRAVNKPQLGIL